jgi:hypothetical protein
MASQEANLNFADAVRMGRHFALGRHSGNKGLAYAPGVECQTGSGRTVFPTKTGCKKPAYFAASSSAASGRFRWNSQPQISGQILEHVTAPEPCVISASLFAFDAKAPKASEQKTEERIAHGGS